MFLWWVTYVHFEEEGDGPGLCFIHEEDKNFIFSKKKKRRKKYATFMLIEILTVLFF